MHTRTVSAAPTASSRVVASSDRLAHVWLRIAQQTDDLGFSPAGERGPPHRGQQMAAALALRAAHGLAATGSEGEVHGSARRLAGMLLTAR